MTTHRIQPLPPALANQIAAGEVVERPASVVKELLENSLDAGAVSIEIVLEKGGLQLIQISDDGHGINKDDLLLALQRHTTSKIASFNDLERVQSLGFRGEALASIASVSRLQLTSKTAGADTAWQTKVEGGLVLNELMPAAYPLGTRIEIRDLFFNTPARRKFLRSEATEFHHVEEVVKRLALSNMQVALSLRHNQRKVLHLPAAHDESTRLQRLSKLCGQEFVEHAVALDVSATNLRLRGWLGLPSFSRNQADSQYFYVNGRHVRDKLLNHALRQAFQIYLSSERYPGYILYLDIDPAEVDVNVHPAKHEVRFRNSRWVHDFLYQSVQRTLAGETVSRLDMPAVNPNYQFIHQGPISAKHLQEQSAFYQTGLTATAPLLFPEANPLLEKLLPLEPPRQSLGKLIGYLHEQYLLLENEHGLTIVNIPKAQGCLLYQHMQKALAEGAVPQQLLLVPLNIKINAAEAAKVERYLDDLQKLGLQLELLGNHTLVLRQVPIWLYQAELETFIYSLVQQLNQQGFVQETILILFQTQHGLALPKDIAAAQLLLSDMERLLSLEQQAACCKKIALHEFI